MRRPSARQVLLERWVGQYGYAGIFSLLVLGIVGLPVPDETVLLLVGYLVRQGTLRALPSFGSACLGSLCGITLSYALGRTVGPYLIHKYGRRLGATDERMERVHRWFGRIGRWTLAAGYYVPGVRHLTAYVAGAAALELPAFALFAYGGGVVWCLSFLALGYLFGPRGARVVEAFHRHLATTVAAAVLLAVAYLALQAGRRRRGESNGRIV